MFGRKFVLQVIVSVGQCILAAGVQNEVEDTTAAVLMVDKYGGKDTPGNMAVNTRLPTHAL